MKGPRRFGYYIGIDVDEVVANLHEPWITWANQRFGLSLDPKGGFAYWNQLPDMVGKEAYDFLTPSIYDADIVKPLPGALAAVNEIRARGHKVVFISMCLAGTGPAKRAWLLRHGFLRWEAEAHRFIPTRDKSNAPVHLLIDDHIEFCRSFRGVSALVTRPHNKNEEWRGVRINELIDVLPYIQ